MNLRWLIGNFADPQYDLSFREQMRLSTVAHKNHLSTGMWLAWTVLVIALPFLLAMKYVYDPLVAMAGYGGRSTLYWIGWLLAILVVFWPWCAWMYRSLYIKPMRRAMRDAGWNLCIHCGYELRDLPDSTTNCPECGRPRP